MKQYSEEQVKQFQAGLEDMMRERKLLLVQLTNRTQAIVDAFMEYLGEDGFQEHINAVLEESAKDMIEALEEGTKAGLYEDASATVEMFRRALSVANK